jgi:hypothetical protein
MEIMNMVGGYTMKSLRSIVINTLILAGLGLGISASAMQPELPKVQIPVHTKPSSSSSIWASMGNGLLTAAYHPIATSAVLAGLGGLYLGYCRKNSIDATHLIKNAQSYTQFLDNPNDPAKPREKYKFWNLSKGSSSDIAEHHEAYYLLLLEKKNPYTSEHEFIKFVRAEIGREKVELLLVRNRLHAGLKECHILPQFRKSSLTNTVVDLIENYRRNAKCEFIKLSKAQLQALDEQIQKLHSFSLFNPKNWHRFIALPCEAELIEQYWKIYQMIAHLDALDYCLEQKEKQINS